MASVLYLVILVGAAGAAFGMYFVLRSIKMI
jgi:hypothetical protein